MRPSRAYELDTRPQDPEPGPGGGEPRHATDLAALFEVAASSDDAWSSDDVRRHALALSGGAAAAASGDALVAGIAFAADMISRLAVEQEWSPERAAALVDAAAAAGGVDASVARTAICSRALRDPRLHELPPELAAEAALRILVALAPVTAASLWVSTSGRRIHRALGVGNGGDGPRFRAAARGAFAGATAPGSVTVLAVPVQRWQRPVAALAVEAEPGELLQARAVAEEAAAVLAIAFEREALLGRGLDRERILVDAGERRLARLAFDIHDGALQDLAALGLELRILRSELPGLAATAGGETRAVARVDGLHGRVAALEAGLRELTRSLEPSTIARRPLAETLAEDVTAFGALHDMATHLDVQGDFAGLTASQRIALVRIVHEALTNAAEHGGASEVRVELSRDRGCVHLRVTDDGCGFDVGRILPAAARKGRLGLVGMSERVRLLGGLFDVTSGPGGPTTIFASLPPWNPTLASPETDGAPSAQSAAAGAAP